MSGSPRWAIVLIAICAGMLASAPVAGAAGETGEISGKVTEFGSNANLANILVEVYAPGKSFSTRTLANGTYSFSQLPPGQYRVFFYTGEAAPSLVTQYYNGKLDATHATLVPVEAGKASETINAELHKGAKLTGEVTEASVPHGTVSNVSVSVSRVSPDGEEYYGATSTNSEGKYEITGLAAGEYKIFFSPPNGSQLVSSFHKESSTLAGAEPVSLAEGETKPINEALPKGGQITGTVTDSVTRKPLANVTVAAYASGGGFEGFGFEEGSRFATTNANGEYTINGLTTGSYAVEFYVASEGLEGYSAQYYNGASTYANASPVAVVRPNPTGGINAALVPTYPIETGAPSISGKGSVGQTLTCSNGSWSASPSPSYARRWLRDGNAISGATGSTYVIQAVDGGHSLSCEVTASNPIGHASARSSSLQIAALITPPPTPPPPHPSVAFGPATNIVVSGGVARVRVSCAVTVCSGAVQVIQRLVIRHRVRHHTVIRRVTLVLATGTYAIAPGRSTLVVLHLTRTGRQKLARASRHRVAAILLASVSGGASTSRLVLLSRRR